MFNLENRDIETKNKILLTIIVVLISFVIWLLPFLDKREIINIPNLELLEFFSYSLIGAYSFCSLIFFDELYYFILVLIFTPFTFAKGFDISSLPIGLIIACVLTISGMIIRLIIYKSKIRYGPLMNGLLLVGLGMILSGINYFNITEFLTMVSVVVSLLFLCLFLYSSYNLEFDELANVLNILGLFIFIQVIIHYLTFGDIYNALSEKTLKIGWGCTNNVAMMMLLIVPFTVYLITKNIKNKKSIFYKIIFILELFATLLSYSRGGMLCMIIMLLCFVIIHLLKSKNKLLTISKIFQILLGFSAIVLIFFIKFNKIFDEIIGIINLNFETMKSRFNIYEFCISEINDCLIFGKGFFAPLYTDKISEGSYLWGHGTYIHALYVSGIMGLITLIYHTIEKYIFLIKKFNYEKMIILFAVLFTGIYGFVDVSFYYIVYMIIYLIILLSINDNKRIDNKKEIL